MKSDIELRHDVLAELKWDPKAKAANISVDVKDGVVTLSGEVNSVAQKWEIEKAAKRVVGVKVIAQEIKVVLPTTSHKSDSEIALAVATAIRNNTYHLDAYVKAAVENGVVTLNGEVDWQFQRNAVEDAIKYLIGIKAIKNQITLKPKISAIDVKSGIDAAINRRAQADIKNVFVSVNGSEITLTGKVQDWSEKNLIIDAAWGTPGVRKVIDHTLFT